MRVSRTCPFYVMLGVKVGVIAAASSIASALMGDNSAPDPVSPREATDPPVQYAGNASMRSAGGGVPLPESIRQVLASPGMSSVEAVDVMKAPEDVSDSSVPWLKIRVQTASLANSGTVELTWWASIAQGAIAELAHVDQVATNQVVGGSVLEAVLPAGAEPLDGGAGYVATGQSFSGSKKTDDELVGAATATLEKFKLVPQVVKVARPLDAVLYVNASLKSSGSNVTWTIDELRDGLAGNPKIFEGLYIEIQSPKGIPLLASGTSYRTGLGGLWFAEGQGERLRAGRGGVARSPG